MRFYKKKHRYYCGVDLHTRRMYVCIVNHEGETLVHRNIPAKAADFLKIIESYREDLAVAAECMFTWYWLADVCVESDIEFVLGHALYMKAIHGAKTKNDRIDSEKIAALLRGGYLPIAYVYPARMRSTRDLLRRRTFLVRKRAEILGHIQNTNSQCNLPEFGKKLAYKANREQLNVAERFTDAAVRRNVEVDLTLLDHYDPLITQLELDLARSAKVHNAQMFFLLRSIPGVGKILALVIMYEIYDIGRFDAVGKFISYARLVKCRKTSDGKPAGKGGSKMGNVHLKWAFSEAVPLFMRENQDAKKFVARMEKKFGKGKAMSILAARLGRAVYWMLKRKEAFDVDLFFARKTRSSTKTR